MLSMGKIFIDRNSFKLGFSSIALFNLNVFLLFLQLLLCMLKMMVGMFVLITIILFGCSDGGRTTNKYTSLPGGGFHHHGGFLAGYF